MGLGNISVKEVTNKYKRTVYDYFDNNNVLPLSVQFKGRLIFKTTLNLSFI